MLTCRAALFSDVHSSKPLHCRVEELPHIIFAPHVAGHSDCRRVELARERLGLAARVTVSQIGKH
jgi:phosphoglycerate dehydrogenase-like enzyme